MRRTITTVFFSWVALMSLYTVIDYSYKYFTPTEHWFGYKEIVPVDRFGNVTLHFEIGDSLNFVSRSYRNKLLHHLEYRDRLMCRHMLGTVFNRVSESVTSSYELLSTDGQIKDGYWTYQGKGPLYPSVCYISARPTLHLPYGIEKVISIRSQEFTVGPNLKGS